MAVHWRRPDSGVNGKGREGREGRGKREQSRNCAVARKRCLASLWRGDRGVRDANNDSESDAATVNVKCQARERGVPVDYFVNEEGGPDTSSSKVGRE